MADVKFKSVDLGKRRIERQLSLIPHRVALVGIPGTAKMPKDGQSGTVDNLAELAFILEKGSVINNLKPRPFMKETRKKAEKRFKGLLRKSYKAIIAGKVTTEQALFDLGEAYEGEMKDIFLTGNFEPNSYITIHGGWMRNKVSGKPFKVEGKKSSRPLINTGNLRQSITHKVKKI